MIIKGLKIILTKKDRRGFIFGGLSKGKFTALSRPVQRSLIRGRPGGPQVHHSLFLALVLAAPRGLLQIYLNNLPGKEASRFRVDNPENKTSPVLNLRRSKTFHVKTIVRPLIKG